MLRYFTLFFLFGALALFAADLRTDTIETQKGPLQLTFIGHGTLMLQWDDKVIHVDPWSRLTDYSQLPKADLVLVTHEHGDHLDVDLIKNLSTEKTTVVLTETCAERYPGNVLKNGETADYENIKIKAVPAYNIQHKRSSGEPFHPKGRGNGYVLTLADTRVYIAGDTEDVPEMADLKDIDIAFLPMNLPYTMTPEMAAHAAGMFHPKILYPYHFGETDTEKLAPLLQDTDIEIRIRDLQ